MKKNHFNSKFFLIDLIFLGLSSWFFFACESSPPEIVDVQWQINIVERLDTKSFEENLTFFVFAKDDDGESDLESLYLMHDDSEQFWKLTKDTWSVKSGNNETWIGCADMVMPDNSPIPRGDYRVLLYDASGTKSEKSIKIDTVVINPKRVKFPSIRGEKGLLLLESNFENTIAIFFDRNRRYIDSVMIEYDKTLVERFPRYRELAQSSGAQLFLYVWDTRKGYGIMSGPYSGLYDDAMQVNK